MTGIRRLFFIFFVLVVGIFLGNLGTRTALLTVVPIFLILLMMWDEKSYRYSQKRKEQAMHHNEYQYHR